MAGHTEIFSETALFETTERRSDIGLVVRIHKARSSIQAISHSQCLVDVLGENTRCQAVLYIVSTVENPFYVTARKETL
jgi:hypothetical protein